MSRLPPLAALAALAAAVAGCQSGITVDPPIAATEPFVIRAGKPVPDMPGERFFRNVRQLTFGGENAEAYWSADGRKLIFQSRHGPYKCDQIFTLDLATGEQKLVSTGDGRTTCAYFLQGDQKIVYASTHLADMKCPPPVMRTRGKYVWAIYKGYDIFTADADGANLKRITDTPGYDAEATVCPITGKLVFTSVRDGDLELYAMDSDGGKVQRLTDRPGYDGGAFFSHDGTKIVLRSGFLSSEQDKKEYFDLLAKGLVEPNRMEITVIDRNGKNFRQVTNNGRANFAPFWHKDNARILFSSNLGSPPDGRPVFDIYMIREDGTGMTKVTNNPSFDGFPMFSPDKEGKYLVFASNRFNPPGKEHETNIFVAEWVENPEDQAPAEAANGNK